MRQRLAYAFALAIVASGPGCQSGPMIVEDPIAALRTPAEGFRVHRAAMEQLDAASNEAGYREALHRVVWRSGYTVEAREAAFRRLRDIEPDELQRTLRQQLPRMVAWAGLTRLCELIADEGWVELSPALVSSWARPNPVQDDDDRPEYLALVRLHAADRAEAVHDLVFDMFVESNRVAQQGLRTRCWELIHRLGQRDRLVALLAEVDDPGNDAFLLDLRAGARTLGIVPHNREEILWLRKLREPKRRAFWNEVVVSMKRVPEMRRSSLELRDLPIIVAAARHAPELLERTEAELFAAIEPRVRDQKHYSHGSRYDAAVPVRDRLGQRRDDLTWGDLAAMELALRAFAIPEVVAHLMDYAERDHIDTSTEYGGVIALDKQGRFEVLEFVPRVRHHDRKFLASQEMLDAGYSSLFHFHFHAQRRRNVEFAGPGVGDTNYADNTRANCLVLTSVRKGALNVDFYRHGRVLVDLGLIVAGGAAGAVGRDEGIAGGL